MTILETFLKIDPMLYVSMFMLPIVLYGYLVSSKTKKRVAAALANPADQLKEKKINVRKEVVSAVFLGSSIAFGVGIIFLISSVVINYKDSSGIFAIPLPAATYPPAPGAVYPPQPPADTAAEAPAVKK